VTRIRFIQTSLARFLLMGFVLVLLGSTVRFVQFAGLMSDGLIQGISKQQTALAGYVASDLGNQLELRRAALRRMAMAMPLDLLKHENGLRRWLAQQQESALPLFTDGLVAVDNSGRLLAGDAGALQMDAADLGGVRSGQAVVLGRPGLDAAGLRRQLPIAAPVLDADGKVQAILIGNTSLANDGFLGRLMAARVGDTGGLLLVSPADKLIVAATDPAMAFQPTPPHGANPLFDQRIQQGYRGPGIARTADGREDVTAAATVPNTGWFVMAYLPTQEALSTLQVARTRLIWQTALAAVVVLATVGGLFAWVMRPLHLAALQADRMTNGELPLTPLPVVRDDETGHLTSAFNRLLEKLDSQRATLAQMANHDALTGLPNRKLLADRMHLALARAQRHGGGVAALFMDLNGFKRINDTLGHDAGDEVLMEVAQRLSRVVRQCDTLARLGGDEFVLLATDLGADPEHALRILAGKCMEAIGRPLHAQGQDCDLGVAIGIAQATKDSTPDTLLTTADKAMYQAKLQGHSGFVIANAGAQ
jgi:diguanylate cyclase (GGDEF)-like protein